MNNICMVGKVVSAPLLKETANGNKFASLELEVERNFPNSEGQYESDVFMITLWRGLAEHSLVACQENAIVSVKGRVSAKSYENKDGIRQHYCEIVAEKINCIA
jgi:single-strand DNA-binding protein